MPYAGDLMFIGFCLALGFFIGMVVVCAITALLAYIVVQILTWFEGLDTMKVVFPVEKGE